jgi:hypothetical protein
VNLMNAFRVKDDDIGVAVLGAGRMGLNHIRTLAGIPNARVVAVADPDSPPPSVAGPWPGPAPWAPRRRRSPIPTSKLW